MFMGVSPRVGAGVGSGPNVVGVQAVRGGEPNPAISHDG
jgi:hypothetical protein